jgi:RNA polymerase sigma-70 factor, ECF subfamily
MHVSRQDAELIDTVLGGDISAFELLYARHSPALFRLALSAADGERADAEDLLHDTWVIAMERLAAFGGRSALRTWLSGILLNQARRWWRSPGRSWLELNESVATLHTMPPKFAERADIERALLALPRRARLVFVLHDAHGHTHAEIAAMLEIEPGTSKSQLFRARRTMAALLADPERSAHGS